MTDEPRDGRRPARRDPAQDGDDASLPNVRGNDRSPVRPDRTPARPERDGRLHDVQYELEYGNPSREDCWQLLPERVTSRLAETAGKIEGWIARHSFRGGPVEAMAFGDRALAIAVPRPRGLDDDGHQFVLHRYEFKAGSLRSVNVRHRPPAGRSPAPQAGVGRSFDGPPSRYASGLSPAFAETLSGLPPRARVLLEGPFLEREETVLRSDSFWVGNPDESDLRPFVLIMASAHRAALGVGRRVIPPGHDRTTAHWELTCWDARVTRRTER